MANGFALAVAPPNFPLAMQGRRCGRPASADGTRPARELRQEQENLGPKLSIFGRGNGLRFGALKPLSH